MGSLAKRLGQWAARSIESESSQIVKTVRANKVAGSLSQLLDTTLKESHDMRVFGMGTLASMASKERYGRFTTNLHGVYSTMEAELDLCQEHSPCATFWKEHGSVLRRRGSFEMDLASVDLVDSPSDSKDSDGTASRTPTIPCSKHAQTYIRAIRAAGESDRATGGVRLLGHAYCRYLADLMGGQVLGAPTRMALHLTESPRQYQFDWPAASRKEYVESLYEALNRSGDRVTEEQRREALEEAKLAFAMNVKIYAEEPLLLDSVRGGLNVVTGFLQRR